MLHPVYKLGGKHPDFRLPCQRLSRQSWRCRCPERWLANRCGVDYGSAASTVQAGGTLTGYGHYGWSRNGLLSLRQPRRNWQVSARRIALRSRRESADAKAKLLGYFGCFAGSGNLEDVVAQIGHLEGLKVQAPGDLVPGHWTLIGDTEGSRPPALVAACFGASLQGQALRSVCLNISKNLELKCQADVGDAAGNAKTWTARMPLQLDLRTLSANSTRVTVSYVDDDFLVLRENDPFSFLEGRLQRFYVKREVYLRTSSRQRFWRGFSGLRDMLPQVPLWLLSALRGLGVFESTTNPPRYGEYHFVPKVESFTVLFDPELLREPVAVVQLDGLDDTGLLLSLLQYVTLQYTPAASPASASAMSASGLEMRASMYTGMLYSGLFWPASFLAACAVLRALAKRATGRPIRDVHVVELASGTGLPSLAAHRCSARVTCTDVSLLAHRLVLTAAQMQPGGEISTRVFDILLDSPERLLEMKPDIVVASDSFYEEALAEALGRHLGTAARSGATVIATDPWRMEGRGQTIFLDSFWKAMAPAAQPSQASQASQAHFEKQCIPDRILDRGLNAMKYGGQVDRSVGVFEFYAQSENQGKSIVLFANGDKYIGGLQAGRKEGDGMYVYADGSAYKGPWSADSMDGEPHPGGHEAESEQTRRLHDLNTKNSEAVQSMKAKLPGERKQAPTVARIQD
ncbi:PIP5K4 [Symbiodinium natans]|uniref:PIP5K4 protein n=1 Tax=Symbiodinium natans TaxID=878477 RepID=A0A812TKT7_9DINO|nr:PIP5K4 [Symbiodinium natans]